LPKYINSMDKFIVSARKYRPQTFDTVVGQEHITTTLRNAIKHHQLAHAFLFCGPRGVGKTTCARILAKTINCENPTKEGEACNSCQSCKAFNEGTSLNIHELDAASNNSVDDIRSLVEQVRFAPQAGKYKVYIIDEVHMLSSSAFNAFLKTLEEPPAYAIFILATTEKHKILPTILSRCQIFDFKRITINDTVDHLLGIANKENIEAEKAALQIIAQKSEGCMRDALSILDKIVSFTNGKVSYQNTLEHLNILDADYYFKMLECMQQQDLAGAMLLYDDIDKKGFEGDLVLNGFMEFIRNLLVCKDEKVAGLLEVVENFRDRYIATAKKTSASYLISALNILNEAEINYKAARNKRLHVELAIIKLTYLQQALDFASGGEPVAKKKLTDNSPAVAFRALKVVEAKPPKSGTGSSVGTSTSATKVPVSNTAKSAGSKKAAQPEAKLLIDTPEVEVVVEEVPEYIPVAQSDTRQPKPVAGAAPVTGSAPLAAKAGLLQNIRQQIASRQNGNSDSKAIPLTLEKLQARWNAFSQQLKVNKNPAAQSFEMARLRIVDNSVFEVVTNNNLEQKFIEQERRNLSDYLVKEFNNRSLLFTIVVDENATVQEPVERTLTARDQFIEIIKQYPLVKELKDRLRLELDY
jgi:DNA polymerase III, subunit gamma and tau